MHDDVLRWFGCSVQVFPKVNLYRILFQQSLNPISWAYNVVPKIMTMSLQHVSSHTADEYSQFYLCCFALGLIVVSNSLNIFISISQELVFHLSYNKTCFLAMVKQKKNLQGKNFKNLI